MSTLQSECSCCNKAPDLKFMRNHARQARPATFLAALTCLGVWACKSVSAHVSQAWLDGSLGTTGSGDVEAYHRSMVGLQKEEAEVEAYVAAHPTLARWFSALPTLGWCVVEHATEMAKPVPAYFQTGVGG